jgi:hypothetical protein
MRELSLLLIRSEMSLVDAMFANQLRESALVFRDWVERCLHSQIGDAPPKYA